MRISDWSSDVCSSDLIEAGLLGGNDQRTDGRVFAKQRSLRPAHQLDMIEIDEVQPAEAHMGEEDIVDDEPDARFRAVIVGVAAHAPDIEAGRTCILLKRGEVRYFSSIVADRKSTRLNSSH